MTLDQVMIHVCDKEKLVNAVCTVQYTLKYLTLEQVMIHVCHKEKLFNAVLTVQYTLKLLWQTQTSNDIWLSQGKAF